MPRLLLILSLIFITTYSFADNTEIITYLDKRESQALLLEENLTQTQEAIEGRLDQAELGIFYFEADSSDKLEEPKESEEYYQKIIAHYQPILDNPSSPKKERLKALSHIAHIKVKQDRYDEAIKLCKDILYRYYPDEQFILEMEAEIHLANANHLYLRHIRDHDDFDNAVRECEAIFNLNLPQEWHAFAKNKMAKLYLKKQDNDKALYWFNRIIKDHPNLKDWPANAHYSIARYYLNQNNKTKAKEHLQTIITKYPNSNWTKPAKDKLKELVK